MSCMFLKFIVVGRVMRLGIATFEIMTLQIWVNSLKVKPPVDLVKVNQVPQNTQVTIMSIHNALI